MKLLLILIAGALVACSTVPTVSLSEPHGLVVTHNGVGGGTIHPVSITAIDGVNLTGDRQSFTLAPGSHTLRVMGHIKNAHLRSPAMDPAYIREPQGARYDLVVDVAEGHRYTIAARFNGPTANDWEPVVLRSEPINR